MLGLGVTYVSNSKWEAVISMRGLPEILSFFESPLIWICLWGSANPVSAAASEESVVSHVPMDS